MKLIMSKDIARSEVAKALAELQVELNAEFHTSYDGLADTENTGRTITVNRRMLAAVLTYLSSLSAPAIPPEDKRL